MVKSGLEVKETKVPQKNSVEVETTSDPSLKGSLVSVFLLGAFIVGLWLSIFYLFISRI